MAIQQTKRQSDLEKRLQLLRRQVYGRESVVSSKYHIVRENQKISHTTNITYLRQDLLKILTFSSVAIGAQIFLFFLVKNNLLKINIF